jgi:hypothetical protein
MFGFPNTSQQFTPDWWKRYLFDSMLYKRLFGKPNKQAKTHQQNAHM